jgi:hypothetical protein
LFFLRKKIGAFWHCQSDQVSSDIITSFSRSIFVFSTYSSIFDVKEKSPFPLSGNRIGIYPLGSNMEIHNHTETPARGRIS